LGVLTTSQTTAILALVEHTDSRFASIASIALGIGFDEPGSFNSMKVRLQAHELLARCMGDIQLGPPPLHLHTPNAEPARVVFVNADPAPATQSPEVRQLTLPETDSTKVVRQDDPACEVEPT
jgi:hypothetical protein